MYLTQQVTKGDLDNGNQTNLGKKVIKGDKMITTHVSTTTSPVWVTSSRSQSLPALTKTSVTDIVCQAESRIDSKSRNCSSAVVDI